MPMAAFVPQIKPGTVIAERYRVLRPLGAGGMGRVYEVLDLVRSERRALKLLHADRETDPAIVERFFREAHVLAQLDHPNIVRMFGCAPLPNGSVYLVMELVEGESLGRFLRRQGSLPVGMVDPIVRDIALALQYAHERGIIHRDLKPSNVMLVPGRTPQAIAGAMLIDFGVALLASAARLTSTGELVGTPRYMAPEQLASWSGADARSDVDALAVLVYECLAGSSPFPGDLGPAALVHAVLHGRGVPLRTVRPDISAAIEEVIARGMALRPGDRHSSMLAFLEDGDRAVRPVEAAPPTIRMGAVDAALFAVPPTRPQWSAAPAPSQVATVRLPVIEAPVGIVPRAAPPAPIAPPAPSMVVPPPDAGVHLASSHPSGLPSAGNEPPAPSSSASAPVMGNPVVASASGHGSSVPAGTGPSAKFAEPPPPGGAWPTGRSVEAAVAAGFVALLFFAVAGFAVLWVWVSD